MVRSGSLTSLRGSSRLPALIGGLCLITFLSIAAVATIYVWPRTLTKPEVVIHLGVPTSSLAKGEAVRFTAPAGTAFKMLDGGGLNAAGNPAQVGWLVHSDGGLIALAADSSDDGCAVAFDLPSQRFEDPCHGAMYALDGQVLHGPATSPLAHLGWRNVGTDSIAVQSLTVLATPS
jgi:hypothetical protein